ncbi:MAG TPA: endo-1,4-beta-xylanase, partial [Rhodothermales bacterium]|nr:endo-1,4-beta-xylanase [Rhodothermales bacterium]
MNITRRQLIKTGAMSAAALALAPVTGGWSTIRPRTVAPLTFRPYPHPLMPPVEFVYAADQNSDPFKSPIQITQEGIVVPEEVGDRPFSINTKWFIEGFGYVWLGADNSGQLYTQEDFSQSRPLNLNVEFAKSRVARNRDVLARYRKAGTAFSTEVKYLDDLSQELLVDAMKAQGERAGKLADQSLLYALWAGEKTELEHARSRIERQKRKEQVYFGCETRQYVWAKNVDMMEAFTDLFNYATVTHYVYDTWYELFEPRRGEYNFGIKDDIVNWLLENDITIEGRPLFWFHPWVTPDWLRQMSFDELKGYVVQHTQDVVGHYGDKILHWEVVNEYHDWANLFRHTPEQITEITRLACETTHDVNPKVQRIINNCCPFAEYVARGHDSGVTMTEQGPPIDRPLRSPRQYIQDITEAGVPFEILGVQIYFPERDLSDIVRMVERMEAFNKPIYVTEMGASSGPTSLDIMKGAEVPGAPYD